MIHTRFYVPKYLTENSKDIHTFLHLLDLALNNNKAKSDDFVSILNPDKCPNKLLPLLASYVGYEYDYNESYDGNRIIIRSYKDMIKNKGNIQGIQLATSVAISMVADKSLIDAQELLNVSFYDYYYKCSNCGYIAYEPFDQCPHCDTEGSAELVDVDTIVIVIEYPLYSAKSYDLIEAVRPAGVACIIYNGSLVSQKETISISDYIKLQSKFLNDGMSEVGGVDAVSGFTVVLQERPTLQYCEHCGYFINAMAGYEKVTTYAPDIKYYVFNTQLDNFVEVNIESQGDFDTISAEKDVFIPTASINECPQCGADDLVKENNSSLRLLYRLYNDVMSYNATVGNIISSIANGNIKSSSDIVGIILRLHINSDLKEVVVIDPVTHKTETNDWSVDLNQSFIFGLKPYIDLSAGSEYFKYTIVDILEKLCKANNTDLSTLKNNNRSNYSYNLVEDDGKYYIQAKKTDTGGGEWYHNYSLLDNASDMYFIDNTKMSEDYDSIYGSNPTEYDFHLGKDTIKETQTVKEIDNTDKNNYFDWAIYYKIVDGEYVNANINSLDDFLNSQDTLYILADGINIDGIVHEDNTDTLKDFSGRYIYVCHACNNIIFLSVDNTIKANYDENAFYYAKVDSEYVNVSINDINDFLNFNGTLYVMPDENVTACPICGGVITPETAGVVSNNNATQLYDHIILQGSYVLDLYFGEKD